MFQCLTQQLAPFQSGETCPLLLLGIQSLQGALQLLQGSRWDCFKSYMVTDTSFLLQVWTGIRISYVQYDFSRIQRATLMEIHQLTIISG